MKKPLIILSVILLLLWGGLTFHKSQKLGATLTEVSNVVKVQTGLPAVFIFKNNATSEIIEVPTTWEEYNKMALKDPVRPTLAGYTYIGGSAGGDTGYTYIPRVLQDNQFFKTGAIDVGSTTAMIRVKLPNEAEKTIKESELIQ